jgi:proteasome accessory factor C
VSRPSATDRARRLLAIVPWIAARPGGVPVGEVCERFGITERHLLADLATMSMVGIEPFTPDVMVEAYEDGNRVFVTLPQTFARPLRVTPAQALALVAAGRSLLGVPGSDDDGPLARGLAKLAAVLGVSPEDTLDVDLGGADDRVLTTLRTALDEHRVVALEYYTYGRDELTRRLVEPHRLLHDAGQWYLSAWCRSSEAERVFRVDRVRGAELSDQTFVAPVPASPGEVEVFRPSVDDPRVVLRLAPAARWVVEQYPVESVDELDDGRLEVTLAVTAPAWFARLVLRLGADAEVVDAPGGLADVPRDAARRVLERYR